VILAAVASTDEKMSVVALVLIVISVVGPILALKWRFGKKRK